MKVEDLEKCTAFLCSMYALVQDSGNNEREKRIFALEEFDWTLQLAAKQRPISKDAPKTEILLSLLDGPPCTLEGRIFRMMQTWLHAAIDLGLYSPDDPTARVVASLKNMLPLLPEADIGIVHTKLSQQGAANHWNTSNLKNAADVLKAAIENSKHAEKQHFVDRYTSLQWLRRTNAMSDKELGGVLLGASGVAPYVSGRISSSPSESKSSERKSSEINAAVQGKNFVESSESKAEESGRQTLSVPRPRTHPVTRTTDPFDEESKTVGTTAIWKHVHRKPTIYCLIETFPLPIGIFHSLRHPLLHHQNEMKECIAVA